MTTGTSARPPCISCTRAARPPTDTISGSALSCRIFRRSSVPTMISITDTGRCLALPTEGRSTTPVVISGAVTMKMISSTSITSMNGTMLISLIVRRRLPPRWLTFGISDALCGGGADVALQDVRELLDEGLELDRDAVDVAREAVVGDHRGYRGEQADRGGDERFRDAGRNARERHLRHVRQPDERMHDSPHRAEQADVRRHRADRREERQPRLDRVELALEAGAHRAACAVEQRAGIGDAALAQLQEFAHAGGEDALHRRALGLLRGVVVQVVEVLAGPELALEGFVGGARAAQAEQLAEDHGPARERG